MRNIAAYRDTQYENAKKNRNQWAPVCALLGKGVSESIFYKDVILILEHEFEHIRRY